MAHANEETGSESRRSAAAAQMFTRRVFDDYVAKSSSNIIFMCHVLLRADASNVPWIWNKKSKSSKGCTSPSNNLLEEYIISVPQTSRVAGLKQRVQELSGIPSHRFLLCLAEKIKDGSDCSSIVIDQRIQLWPLREKEIRCSELKRNVTYDHHRPWEPVLIIAFQDTTMIATVSYPLSMVVQKFVGTMYGDEVDECDIRRIDPLSISKEISVRRWPRNPKDLKVGLRVDALDLTGHWYSGSVVKVKKGKENRGRGSLRARVHFDNFERKWDEWYTFDQFVKGDVLQPLHRKMEPKPGPMEIMVCHRYQSTMKEFGMPFFVHCHNEWTMARFGAHILVQASRFLSSRGHSPYTPGESRLYEKAHATLLEIIEELINSDRNYIVHQLTGDFDLVYVDRLTSDLSERIKPLLKRLPFQVCLCRRKDNDENCTGSEFPFTSSLVRTARNYIHARHYIVLNWRQLSRMDDDNPVMYVAPMPVLHKESAGILLRSMKEYVSSMRSTLDRVKKNGVDNV